MSRIFTAVFAATLLVSAPAAFADGDAKRGAEIYHACQDCHSLDENDVGPRHRGVFGRPAASVPDYNYSAALRNSKLVWDAATLDKWLTNPLKFVPGAKMGFVLEDPQARADVIEYLKEIAK
jgi:cytochrome c